MTPVRIPMYMTRQEAGSLHAGGIGRMAIWLDRPILKRICSAADPSDPRRSSYTFSSNACRSLQGKLFRKLDRSEGGMAERLWDMMAASAFPGIPWEEWCQGNGQDHPLSIPCQQWVGEASLLVSLEPFEGGVEVPMVVTGPFESRDIWTPGAEASVEEVLVWFTPPQFQALDNMEPGDGCPFTGTPFQQHWDNNGFSWDQCIPLHQLAAMSAGPIVDGARRALEDEFGQSTNAVVGRSWSRSFTLWMSVDEATR